LYRINGDSMWQQVDRYGPNNARSAWSFVRCAHRRSLLARFLVQTSRWGLPRFSVAMLTSARAVRIVATTPT
jgi:hypothetical protein